MIADPIVQLEPDQAQGDRASGRKDGRKGLTALRENDQALAITGPVHVSAVVAFLDQDGGAVFKVISYIEDISFIAQGISQHIPSPQQGPGSDVVLLYRGHPHDRAAAGADIISFIKGVHAFHAESVAHSYGLFLLFLRTFSCYLYLSCNSASRRICSRA